MIKVLYRAGLTVIALVIFLVITSGFPRLGGAESVGRLWINSLEGEVLLNVTDNDDWSRATFNFPLQIGDKLWIGEGAWVQINHISGSILKIHSQSIAEIENLQRVENQDHLQIALPKGTIYGVLNESAYDNLLIKVDTPVLSLRAGPLTTFQVESSDSEKFSSVSIFRGEADVETEGISNKVSEGKALTVRSGGLIVSGPISMVSTSGSQPVEKASPESSYGYYAGNNSSYTPEPLNAYNYLLNQYGRWDYVNEYGRVWVPYATPSGWAPFRHGRWVWRSPHYVWVSYWPWGWIPFHYGRWSYTVGIGWYWVPPYRHHVYWCPGAVGWWRTNTHTYWIPLAPGELYYGYGYFGPWSVNIYLHQKRYGHPWPPRGYLHRKYHNARHHRAVSGLSIPLFLNGNKGLKYASTLPSGHKLDPSSSVAQPDLKPQKLTMLPSSEISVNQRNLLKKDLAYSEKWLKSKKMGERKSSSAQDLKGTSWSKQRFKEPDKTGTYNKSSNKSEKLPGTYQKYRWPQEKQPKTGVSIGKSNKSKSSSPSSGKVSPRESGSSFKPVLPEARNKRGDSIHDNSFSYSGKRSKPSATTTTNKSYIEKRTPSKSPHYPSSDNSRISDPLHKAGRMPINNSQNKGNFRDKNLSPFPAAEGGKGIKGK